MSDWYWGATERLQVMPLLKLSNEERTWRPNEGSRAFPPTRERRLALLGASFTLSHWSSSQNSNAKRTDISMTVAQNILEKVMLEQNPKSQKTSTPGKMNRHTFPYFFYAIQWKALCMVFEVHTTLKGRKKKADKLRTSGSKKWCCVGTGAMAY